jgi:hypothetical protein
MTLNQQVFKNQNFQFISGITISGDECNRLDFEIYSSDTKNQERWDEILFVSKLSGSSIIVTFQRPINSFLFKVEFIGDFTNIKVAFNPYKPLSKTEALNKIAEKSIIFVGCARNCAAKIHESLKNLEAVGKLFKSYKIIIFENDSSDETLRTLHQMKLGIPLEIITMTELDQHFQGRTHRLSFARNTLFQKVKNEAPDYFCVADLDGVMGRELSIGGVLSNFTYLGCWDAVFPVTNNFYYDVWALRQEDICSGDYMVEINRMSPLFDAQAALDFHLRRVASIKFRDLKGWLSVDSAFGGMGFYKTNSFVFSNYFGGITSNEVCEHVRFHKKAKLQGAMLYINPNFIVDSEF